MKAHNTYINMFRDHKAELRIYGCNGDLCNGVFRIPRSGYELLVIASNGDGWDHVSVSRSDAANPSWDDMCEAKKLFFDDSETVVQFYMVVAKHINVPLPVLHLWKPQGEEIKLPPRRLF